MKKDVNHFIEQELGNKFIRILEDAGVFKQDQNGVTAFKRFIHTL
ncbi:hypothetical protein [Pseudogracilibacillus sp. SO30301A]